LALRLISLSLFLYFGQIIAPGSRLGWFTCSALFAERLEREGETALPTPCGFSQVNH